MKCSQSHSETAGVFLAESKSPLKIQAVIYYLLLKHKEIRSNKTVTKINFFVFFCFDAQLHVENSRVRHRAGLAT